MVYVERERETSPVLGIVSLVCGLGSVAFLSAPMMFVAFAVLVALAGLVTGVAAIVQGQTLLGVLGTAAGGLMTLVYVAIALT